LSQASNAHCISLILTLFWQCCPRSNKRKHFCTV
jgi:hypothetical protein